MSRPRQFLLLQGPCSPFFAELARALLSAGHGTHLIDVCGGDVLYRAGLGAIRYRGSAGDLPTLVDESCHRHQITDLVLFGDQRPLHRAAVDQARRYGIQIHVFEEGYLRPYWVTLEPQGVNACSLLPKDPCWFREASARLGPAPLPVPFRNRFSVRATHDVLYHLAGVSNPLAFPHYRNHAPVTAPIEYLGYLRRFARMRATAYAERRRLDDLLSDATPYFVLLLQLDGDAQIRHHSPYGGMAEVIDQVLTSFALHAPANTRLVIKNHPLDMGLGGHRQHVQRLGQALSIAPRTAYLERADLNRLLPPARGVITVNSTAGFVALEHGRPTLTLGAPVYALAGLTHRADGDSSRLDAFWAEPRPPERRLFHDLRTTLLHTVQINGGFYCRRGRRLAVTQCVQHLSADALPLEKLLTWLPRAA